MFFPTISRVLIIGAGAIGSLIAVRLARAGIHTRIALRSGSTPTRSYREFTLTHSDGYTESANIEVVDPFALDGHSDFVIVAVKASDSLTAATAAVHAARLDSPIVLIANGLPWWVTNDFANPAADVLVDRQIVAASVYHAAERDCSASVQVRAVRRIVVGPVTDTHTAAAAKACRVLNRGNLGATLTNDARLEAWTKLCANVVTGPLCLLTDKPVSSMLCEPSVLSLAHALVAEIVAIARAEGVDISGSASTVEELSHLGSYWPSMVQDVRAGRLPEIESTLTAPLACSIRRGVPAPVLELIRARVIAKIRGAGLMQTQTPSITHNMDRGKYHDRIP